MNWIYGQQLYILCIYSLDSLYLHLLNILIIFLTCSWTVHNSFISSSKSTSANYFIIYVYLIFHILYVCISYRSLTTYILWSPMLRFVHDYITLYNVRERRVHLSEANPIGFVQNVHCIVLSFWGYHVQPGVSVL